MATRRIISQEKSLLEKDDSIGSNPAAGEKSNIAPAVPAPLTTNSTLQLRNSTYAGALAAIIANVVLLGYILVAMAEDKSDQEGQGLGKGGSKEAKKDR
ncbi:vacuolar ATPase assembly integral membrane protein vma21 [Collariella sp. IMI 366227]|nr:vacuolar ATPase assembly integral membrane protein vma21 [Collariella sp. IMI 366227]